MKDKQHRQKINKNCTVFQQVWVEGCASLGRGTRHMLWGLFRNGRNLSRSCFTYE